MGKAQPGDCTELMRGAEKKVGSDAGLALHSVSKTSSVPGGVQGAPWD